MPHRIAIASDHAAFAMKAELADWLRERGHEVLDLGTEGTESVDYPDYGYRIGEAIADGRARFGVALCGSGVGISIAANRNPAVRCALVSEPVSARLARNHNDANVLALGARNDRHRNGQGVRDDLPQRGIRRRPPPAPRGQA
ncbi:MAG: RpiB/LacA/LacB family sugar-phosphate isomerase [Sphingomonas sp.]